MITKKQTKEFIKQVNEFVNTLDNVQIYDDNVYKLPTKYGTLRISIHDTQFYLFSVFTQFDEMTPQIEKDFSRTGKYNFHEKDMEVCINDFKAFITHIKL